MQLDRYLGAELGFYRFGSNLCLTLACKVERASRLQLDLSALHVSQSGLELIFHDVGGESGQQHGSGSTGIRMAEMSVSSAAPCQSDRGSPR